MSKEKEFFKNTIILFIGKFSTQIISFLLIPLYTYHLSTSNYGYVDLVQTYISLLAPVLLLQLDSAVFRHLIDIRNDDNTKKIIISSSSICILLLILISLIIFIIVGYFWKIHYFPYIIISMITGIVNTYVMSIARGNGHNQHYAIASIISSIITFIINIIFIIILNYDARTILIAASISNIISFVYIVKAEKIHSFFSIKYFDKYILKKLLKYSVPMIPNVLSWWIVGLSDRTIIVHFVSTAANGIYSISCKFSNLLNSIFSIFSMSWHETASLHINDNDASEFFSKMIVNIFNLFLIASIIIIGFLPIAFNIMIGNEYLEAYNYIPILLTANICNVLVGLLGGIYIAKKMTKKVAITTIFSAIINIVVNLLFVKRIGLFAACISTFVSYFIMIIYRYYDINKLIKIRIYDKNNIFYIISFLFLIVLYYLKFKIFGLIVSLIILCIYVINNKRIIMDMIVKMKRRNIIRKEKL